MNDFEVVELKRLGLRFHEAMIRGSERLKKEIAYNPTRFLQMVAEHGGVDAVKRLVMEEGPSDGFTRLWESRRLCLSVEFHVLLPEYELLFSQDERERARGRPESHDFDIDRHLGNRQELEV